jgi:YfiH family protein
LNLGHAVGDAPERVDENVLRLCRAAGLPPDDLHTVSQVHGDAVVHVGADRRGKAAQGPRPQADALWTGEPGLALGIKVADCVPVLIADPRGRRVAAVHSGWRGTDAEIVSRAAEALVRAGSAPADLHVAIGPSIRVCCYKVGADLADRFQRRFGPEVVITEDGAPHLDLVRALRVSLARSGVPGEQVDVLPECTHCDRRLYFSHRRDRGQTGRHLGFVACAFQGEGPGPVS